jgi:chromosome segregation ATPase
MSASYRDDLQAALARAEDAERELERLRGEGGGTLSEELTRMRARLNETMRKLEAETRHAEELRQRLTKVDEKALERLRQEHFEMAGDLARAKRRADELEEQNTTARADSEALRRRVEELLEDMADLQQQQAIATRTPRELDRPLRLALGGRLTLAYTGIGAVIGAFLMWAILHSM